VYTYGTVTPKDAGRSGTLGGDYWVWDVQSGPPWFSVSDYYDGSTAPWPLGQPSPQDPARRPSS
jgi:hypothetical protein